MPIFVGTGGADAIDGGATEDTVQGNAGDDRLNGAAGNDVVEGGAGNDSISGGAGNDTLDGGAGNDSIFVDGNGDVVREAVGGGTDAVFASTSFSLTLGAEVESLNYAADPGSATAATAAANYGIAAGVSAATAAVNLTGNEFAQTINGTAGNNVLVGGRNTNPLAGDTLNGGDGNDTLVVNNVNDVVNGGNGTDTVFVSIADLEAQGQAVATFSLGAGTGVEVVSAQNQSGTENFNVTGSAAGGETIIGNFGANTISGGGGGDTLIGLNGNDTYQFNNAGDLIQQETGGTDTVNFLAGVGASFSFLTASAGAMKDLSIEVINLGNGTTSVTGTSVAQTINGTAADETLNGAGGSDTLIGGAGNDTYVVDVDGEVITEVTAAAGGATDVVIFNGTSGGYNLADGTGVEVMAAGDSTTGARLASNGDINGAAAGTPGVYLVGNEVSQSIFGAGGNDILNGDRGTSTNADTLLGGAGNDIYRVFAQTDVVDERTFDAAGVVGAVDAGGVDQIFTSASYDLAANAAATGGVAAIEVLSAADQSATGTAFTLTGATNANTIIGAGGNDTIDGGANVTAAANGANVGDRLQGNAGNDTYLVRSANDVVVEAAGGGTDTVTLQAAFSSTAAAANTYVLNAGAEIEVLNVGASGVTNVTGNEFAQTINGSAVAETIAGGGGADTLRGGDGADTYLISDAAATIIDNQGLNTVTYTGAAGGGVNVGDQVTVNLINTTQNGGVYLVGNNQVQTIIGGNGNDILNGNGGLNGGNGDTLQGGAGNDTYRVFNSNFNNTATASAAGDQIVEGANAGTDTVFTSANYVLSANVENLSASDANLVTNLTLVGNTLANSIAGSNGNNVLVGGEGQDFLTGLGGADKFHFAHTGANNADTIADFNSAQGDKISLDAGVFTGFGPTVDGSEFQLGTIATGTQATILYDQATGRVFYDADGAGAGAAVLFAQLLPGTTLSASDFEIAAAGSIPTPAP